MRMTIESFKGKGGGVVQDFFCIWLIKKLQRNPLFFSVSLDLISERRKCDKSIQSLKFYAIRDHQTVEK